MDATADGLSHEVRGQRFTVEGTELDPPFAVSTDVDRPKGRSDTAIAPNGSFVVTWDSYWPDGSGWEVFARLFDAAARPIGREVRSMRLWLTTSSIQPWQWDPTDRSSWSGSATEQSFPQGVFAQFFAQQATGSAPSSDRSGDQRSAGQSCSRDRAGRHHAGGLDRGERRPARGPRPLVFTSRIRRRHRRRRRVEPSRQLLDGAQPRPGRCPGRRIR